MHMFVVPTLQEGADCSLLGTTIENVQPEENFMFGVGTPGLIFVGCLNDACTPDGSCIGGYTGQFCTECLSQEPGVLVVATDDFECEECASMVNLNSFCSDLASGLFDN